MEFIAGKINGKYLSDIHKKAIQNCDAVKAAVAYAAKETLIIDDCIKANIPLIFWGRYDESQPVAIPILKRFIEARSPGIVCKLVPDIFHPKVIWWQGAGAYIGSANLTTKGWYDNIEAGIFLEDSELVEFDILRYLDDFFHILIV